MDFFLPLGPGSRLTTRKSSLQSLSRDSWMVVFVVCSWWMFLSQESCWRPVLSAPAVGVSRCLPGFPVGTPSLDPIPQFVRPPTNRRTDAHRRWTTSGSVPTPPGRQAHAARGGGVASTQQKGGRCRTDRRRFRSIRNRIGCMQVQAGHFSPPFSGFSGGR